MFPFPGSHRQPRHPVHSLPARIGHVLERAQVESIRVFDPRPGLRVPPRRPALREQRAAPHCPRSL